MEVLKDLALVLIFTSAQGLYMDKYTVYPDLIVREIYKKENGNGDLHNVRIDVLSVENEFVYSKLANSLKCNKIEFGSFKFGNWAVDGSRVNTEVTYPISMNDQECAKVTKLTYYDMEAAGEHPLEAHIYYCDIPDLREKVKEKYLRFFHFYQPEEVSEGQNKDFKIKKEVLVSDFGGPNDFVQTEFELESVTVESVDKQQFLKFIE